MLNGSGIKIFSGLSYLITTTLFSFTPIVGTSHPELAEIIARRYLFILSSSCPVLISELALVFLSPKQKLPAAVLAKPVYVLQSQYGRTMSTLSQRGAER